MIASLLCSVTASSSSRLKRGPDGALYLLEGNELYKKVIGATSFSSIGTIDIALYGEPHLPVSIIDIAIGQENAYYICRDSIGYTWIDAVAINDVTDNSSVFGVISDATSIELDSEGNIFVGASQGACTLWRAPHETEVFAEVLSAPETPVVAPVASIKLGLDGRLFIELWETIGEAYLTSIHVYSTGILQYYYHFNDFPVIADFTVDQDEKIFFVDGNSPYHICYSDFSTIREVAFEPDVPIQCEADGTGVYFVLTQNYDASYSIHEVRHLISYECVDSDSGVPPIDFTAYGNSDPVTILGSGTLARTGYTFSGWKDQNDVEYEVDDEIAYSEPLRLALVWTQHLSMTYDGNGETGGTVPVDSGEYDPGETTTVLGNSGSLAKTLSKFMGWNTLASGLGTTYREGDGYVFGSIDAKLYAKWVPKYIAYVLGAWLTPILSALTPTVPLYWSTATPTVDEYVVLSSVFEGRDPKTNRRSDSWQFTIVTRSAISRAHEIEMAIFEEIQDYKGTKSGQEITSISFLRSADVSDQTTGESILAVEYRINYQGV